MEDSKEQRNTIHKVEWSLISHDTNFACFFFENTIQFYNYKREHYKTTQIACVTLQPVVDKEGNVFNPRTPVVFNLN